MEEICDGCILSSMSNFKFVIGTTNDDNERCIMMNVDENVDDLKYYVGTSIYILES